MLMFTHQFHRRRPHGILCGGVCIRRFRRLIFQEIHFQTVMALVVLGLIAFHAGKQLFRLRLNDDQLVNQTKCLLPGTPLPAILGSSFFVFNDGIESVPPSPRRNS